MRENFKRDKKRIEEAKKKKQEEKRNRRLNEKSPDAPVSPETLPSPLPGDTL